MEKLTKADIRNIEVGQTKTFSLSNYRACHSAANYAYKLSKLYPESGIRYSCKINGSELTITANRI